jgi:4-amino-4-deoxy-L-arabinose transferase
MWKHPDLFSYYIKEEVVARLTSDRFHRNPEWYKPLVIFAPVLILGEAHWFWLSGSLKKAWREFPRDQRIFLGLWFALPLAIFCLAKSRLPLYVLPLSIPLTLFLANAIARKRNTVRLRNAGALFLGLVLLVVLTRSLLGLVPMHQNMRQLHADVAGAGEGQIVALLKEKAYGLQFYAAGKVNWIGAKGEQRKDSLRSFLQSASGKFRLVARAKDRPMVEEALRARKTHGSTREMNDWIVVTFVL